MVKTVDLDDLEQLIEPCIDDYFEVAKERKSMTRHERRLAQRNRIILTRKYFRRMELNAVLFQEMARTYYAKVQHKAADEYTVSDRLLSEILQRSTILRIDLTSANLRLTLYRWSGLYTKFQLIEPQELVQQYCQLTEAVLAFSRSQGRLPYENLRSAL